MIKLGGWPTSRKDYNRITMGVMMWFGRIPIGEVLITRKNVDSVECCCYHAKVQETFNQLLIEFPYAKAI
ncbi:hypothetical protein H5410_061092 [Solanum commersonii]|uniref:Uncharacterized protein n=1 Tax=Solanum commersonii TaxID=4109 RepID=A0A9J5W8J6_SOLCO|nr:hypothetical protein H5410_061092 [Solanum commersonii]